MSFQPFADFENTVIRKAITKTRSQIANCESLNRNLNLFLGWVKLVVNIHLNT